MTTQRKHRVLWAGALLAVGAAGSACTKGDEDSGGSLEDRRVAQLRAQPFDSYGDGKLQQEIKIAQPGTGGSGTVPGSGSIAGPAAQQQREQQESGQSAGPVWRFEGQGAAATPGTGAAQQGETRPHRDSGSSEKN